MPLDAVIVRIIQDRKTGFSSFVQFVLSIVRLRFLQMASVTPWLIAPVWWKLVGRKDLSLVARPEPAENVLRYQVGSVFAAIKVTEAARRPQLRDIVQRNELEDQVILGLRLNVDGIHAVVTTQVTRVEPVVRFVLVCLFVRREKIAVTLVVEVLRT